MKTYLVKIAGELITFQAKSEEELLNHLKVEFGCPSLRLKIYEM